MATCPICGDCISACDDTCGKEECIRKYNDGIEEKVTALRNGE